MISNKSVETYLSKLNEALEALPLATRADIIVAVHEKIQITTTQKSQSISATLAEMPTPSELARTYLTDTSAASNINEVKKSPFAYLFRWIVITFSLFGLIVFLTVGAIIWKFTPIVSITESGTSFLGGTFKIKEKTELFHCPIPDYRGKEKPNVSGDMSKNITA